MPEKIVVGNIHKDAIVSTIEIEVETIHFGYPGQRVRWRTYYGQDKDQSPTGWGINLYEPLERFPGLFERKEVLDHWDGPVEKEEIQAIMVFVAIRLQSEELKKEDVGNFIKKVLYATRAC